MDDREKTAVMVLRMIGLTLTAISTEYWLMTTAFAIGNMTPLGVLAYSCRMLLLPLTMLGFTMLSEPLGRWAAGSRQKVSPVKGTRRYQDPPRSRDGIDVFGEVFEQMEDGRVVRKEKKDGKE